MTPPPPPLCTILLLGDSITQFSSPTPRVAAKPDANSCDIKSAGPGWGDLLGAVFDRRADVVNRGFSGYNTGDAVAMLPSLPNAELAAVVVWFGANDAADPGLNPFEQHVSLPQFEANLLKILSWFAPAPVVLVTPPPIHASKYKQFRRALMPGVADDAQLMDRTAERAAQYAQVVRRVVAAASANVQLADMFRAVSDQPDVGEFLEDGLHLSAQGDKLAFELILAALLVAVPRLKVEPDPVTGAFANSGSQSCTQPRLPWWDEMAKRHPQILDAIPAPAARFSDMRPCIVLLGDSITQQSTSSPAWIQARQGPGWGDLLQARYARRADVCNRGLSGYNSLWGLGALSKVWKPQRSSVELVTVFFGANDAALASLNPQQHVPLATFSQNLREIVSRVQSEWHAKRVLVVGPPPIHREKYLAWRRQRPANVSKPDEELLDRTLEQALQYSSAARAVAASCAGRVGFVDLIQAFAAAPQPLEMLLSDGLHLTGLGNALVFGAVHAALAQHFPELVVTAAEDGGFGAQGSCCDALRPHGAWFQDLPRVQEAARLKRTKI